MKPTQSRKTAGRRLLPALLSATLLLGAAAVHAQSPLSLEHTAPALHAAQLVGRTSALKPLSLTLVLPLRNRAMLDAQIKRISDPKDALYGHYLTPEEFAQQFGPDQSDVDAVSAFAQKHGLAVGEVSPDLTLIHVSGSASSVEAAFGVQINNYVGADGRAFYAADREPTVAPTIAGRLLSVLGLSNAQRPRAFSRAVSATPLLTYNGNAGLAPRDVKNIYGLAGTTFTGTGQVAGLFEVGTFTQSDINTYFSTYGVSIPVHPVSVDGYSTTSAPGDAAAEVTLDIDMYAALAPGLSQIRVYEATDDQNANFTTELVDSFTAMANETAANRPNVISVSYGESEVYEATADYQALDQVTAHLASQGQTVCVASGDAGAYTDQSAGAKPNASFPADDPYVLCVGGTNLRDGLDANNNCTYLSETSWSDTADTGRGPIGTGGGGGYSAYFPFPTYQSGSFTAAGNPQGSLSKRNVPDVSLYGDYDTGGYDIYFSDPTFGPGWGGYNGTSASSPLWAAFLADVNQARAAKSLAAVGFSNPAIYQQAESSSYATLFHDIADGSNNLFYKAVKGYDNSTGWGSFQGSSLLTALSTSAAAVVPTALSLSPNPVVGGQNVTGKVTLSAAAPAGGALVSVSVNGSAVSSFTIAAGQSSGTFTLATAAVSATTTETVGAAYNGTTVSATLTISPASAKPTITGFSPSSGPAGTSVVITGTNFGGVKYVKFGGVTSTFTLNSPTQITAKVAAAAVTGPITAVSTSGTATSATPFTVTGGGNTAPTITSFTPTSGPAGTSVLISGTNFTGVSSVKFGGVAAVTFAANSATQVQAVVPSGAVTGSITITTPGGTVSSTASFTVTTAGKPTITGFSPSSGPAGTSVVITGTNFGGVKYVKFGGVTSTFTLNSPTQITAKVAAAAVTGPITAVSTSGTATSATPFTVTSGSSAPTITSFSPASGPAGTDVLVNGTNLTSVSGVTFGGVAAVTFAANSNTQVEVIVPSGAVTGTITITTPSGTATSSGTYTVTASAVTLSNFGFNPNPGFSSGLSQGTVTLSGPAPTGGASVAITNNGNTLATVVIPAGQTTGSYAQTLPTVTASTSYPFAAAYSGTTLNTSLVVNPTSVTLSGFNLSPNPVASGGTITATVTLSAAAPAGGAAVTITQGTTTLGYVPITAGSTSVTFTLTAPTESTPTTVAYTAAYNGASMAVNETVN